MGDKQPGWERDRDLFDCKLALCLIAGSEAPIDGPFTRFSAADLASPAMEEARRIVRIALSGLRSEDALERGLSTEKEEREIEAQAWAAAKEARDAEPQIEADPDEKIIAFKMSEELGDGFQPSIVDNPEAVLDAMRGWMDVAADMVGTGCEVSIIEMTRKEFEELPSL